MKQWFICKVKYDKVQEDGTQKKITEQYVIDALSFTEAEERIIEELSHYISGEFEVKDISLSTFGELYHGNGDRWYKVKLVYISADERTGKEKFFSSYILVQGDSLMDAIKTVQTAMANSMADYHIAAATETAIIDVFEHQSQKIE